MTMNQFTGSALAAVLIAASGPALAADLNSEDSFLGIKIGQPIKKSIEPCASGPRQNETPCFNQDLVSGASDINHPTKLGFPYKLSVYYDNAGNVSEISLESSRLNAPFFKALLEMRFGKPIEDKRDYSYSVTSERNIITFKATGWTDKKIAIWLADPDTPGADKFVVTVLSRQASDAADAKHAENMNKFADQL